MRTYDAVFRFAASIATICFAISMSSCSSSKRRCPGDDPSCAVNGGQKVDRSGVCQSQCFGKCNVPDSCDSLCSCSGELVCNPNDECIDASLCTARCETMEPAWQCGSICGHDCGTCGPEQTCDHGVCKQKGSCVPRCEPGTCGDDGCAGSCACAASSQCNANYACVVPEKCTDTCESAGRECGTVCGLDCGSCASGTCVLGRCETSAKSSSCEDCRLRLVVVSKDNDSVTLGVDFDTKQGPLPRMIDIRIYSNRNVVAQRAIAGTALQSAGKQLYVDPVNSGRTRKVGPRTFGFYGLSLSNTSEIGSGRLAEITFDLGGIPAGEFVAFQIRQRRKTFAPTSADHALHSERYDSPVILER